MSEDNTQTIAEDDWAAAMAEQAAPVAVQTSPEIFPELSGNATTGGLAKDIDFILDIPVLLTVELGGPKSRSRICSSWRRDRWSNWMGWPASRWMCSSMAA